MERCIKSDNTLAPRPPSKKWLSGYELRHYIIFFIQFRNEIHLPFLCIKNKKWNLEFIDSASWRQCFSTLNIPFNLKHMIRAISIHCRWFLLIILLTIVSIMGHVLNTIFSPIFCTCSRTLPLFRSCFHYRHTLRRETSRILHFCYCSSILGSQLYSFPLLLVIHRCFPTPLCYLLQWLEISEDASQYL